MHHLWQASNTPYRTMFQCMPSCTVPKVAAIFETSTNISPTWHQMSSDVIKCHIKRCLPIGYHCLILQNRNQTMEKNWLRRTTAFRERRAAIRRRRILCSSEQSKLCFRQPETFRASQNQLARQKPGDFSPKSKNPIKRSPDVNMENGTKKLSLVAFFPRKRKQSCHMLTDFSCITCLLTDKIELYRLFRILRKKTSSGCELPFALLTTLPLQNILQWYL